MTDVRIQGTPVSGRVKPLEPTLAPHAKQILDARRDGYDTYGVSTPEGDKLILTKSNKPLAPNATLTVDGKPAKVTFVENEANTFGERFKAPFKSTGGRIAMGVGSAIAMGIAIPFGVAFGVTPVAWVVGLTLWAAVGAGVVGGVMAAGSAVNAATKKDAQPDESVTDGLTRK